MQIIPVIDLKNQQVVLAKSGDRNNYQPVSTPLCPSASPFDVIQRFLALYPFPQFYIADLDAIMQLGNQNELIGTLVQQYPDIIFWIDNGMTISEFSQQPRPGNCKTIIGSESQTVLSEAIPDEAILSLDFKNDTPLGAPSLFDQAQWWPEKIIVMTLNQIGLNNGPDFKKLAHFRQSYPHKQFVAAGGIRGLNDLLRLSEIGIDQALVASCLHSGQLTSKHLDRLFA